jgi:hypothetical protein
LIFITQFAALIVIVEALVNILLFIEASEAKATYEVFLESSPIGNATQKNELKYRISSIDGKRK